MELIKTNKRLKPLSFNNYDFRYERECLDAFNDVIITKFYCGSENIKTRKYLGIFGPYVLKEKPILVFKLDFDILSNYVTLEDVEKGLKDGISVILKKEAIARGTIK